MENVVSLFLRLEVTSLTIFVSLYFNFVTKRSWKDNAHLVQNHENLDLTPIQSHGNIIKNLILILSTNMMSTIGEGKTAEYLIIEGSLRD